MTNTAASNSSGQCGDGPVVRSCTEKAIELMTQADRDLSLCIARLCKAKDLLGSPYCGELRVEIRYLGHSRFSLGDLKDSLLGPA